MKCLIFILSIALTITSHALCNADIVVYRDADTDTWGDIADQITIANFGEMPDGFTRLSHDLDDHDQNTFPENGPTLTRNSGFFNATVGQEFSFVVPLSGTSNVEFFDTVLPNAAMFTSNGTGTNISGTFSWTPTTTDVGLHGFETYARFVGGPSSQISGTFATIQVNAVPEPTSSATVVFAIVLAACGRRRRI